MFQDQDRPGSFRSVCASQDCCGRQDRCGRQDSCRTLYRWDWGALLPGHLLPQLVLIAIDDPIASADQIAQPVEQHGVESQPVLLVARQGQILLPGIVVADARIGTDVRLGVGKELYSVIDWNFDVIAVR